RAGRGSVSDTDAAPPERTVELEMQGDLLITKETVIRQGFHSVLRTVLNVRTWTVTQHLYRRVLPYSPDWVDVTDQARRGGGLNPPGVPEGQLSVEWNMPGAAPRTDSLAGAAIGKLAETLVVQDLPPSLVIPYVKDSILADYFEFTPEGQNP